MNQRLIVQISYKNLKKEAEKRSEKATMMGDNATNLNIQENQEQV